MTASDPRARMRAAVWAELGIVRAPFAGMSRRGFLQAIATATGGVMLAAHLPRAGAAPAAPPAPLLYVRIDPDDRVTLQIPKSEMGQGVRTSLALLIAEELDADWATIEVETARFDPRYGEQGTGGSSSVWDTFTRLRRVGAAMRMMLIGAAAARWRVPAAQLRAERGQVLHAATGRRARFGALASDAAHQPVPSHPALRPRAAWKLLGKEHIGKDVDDIVHGRARYGLDQRLPGMLFASIERPREYGATLAGFDAPAALAVPGVRQVFALEPTVPGGTVHTRIAGGVAVVATTTWAALEGRRRVAARWRSGPHAGESTASYRQQMVAALERPGHEQVNRRGDPDAELASARAVIRADYGVPFLAHATLEPMSCTARWEGDHLTLWSPTQDPELASIAIMARFGLSPAQLAIHIPLLGGGFGRRINTDFSIEAALVARQASAPVQVMWTREDDLGHDFYRPCGMHRLEASLDDHGWPRALRHRMCNPALGATYRGDAATGLGSSEAHGVADAFYRVPHRKSEYTLLRSGVPRGFWRAVNTTHTTFALECFLDELAAAAGQDPLDYRLALIDEPLASGPAPTGDEVFVPQRMKDCLALAADQAGWRTPVPEGRGRGIACCFDHQSYAAAVIEASVEAGHVIVHRVVCAADCGTVIHPNGARAQIEGAITQGLSAALRERVTIAAGGVVETNFHSYPLLRFHEAPARIDVHFVDRPDAHVTGLGEPALPTVAPALANALFQVTGQRLRELPLELPAERRPRR
jgi:isoquinoline 1-oxidoreductase subunit beta